MKDYYKILKVKRGATKKKITQNYEELISKYNVESYTGEAKKLVEEQIADIKEAYSILSDDNLRNKYNIELDKEQIETTKEFEKNLDEKLKKQEKEDEEELEEDVYDVKKGKKQKADVGTLHSLSNLTKTVFSELPKIKFDFSKESILAFIGAVLIVAVILVILWFLPFTHDFIKSFLTLS